MINIAYVTKDMNLHGISKVIMSYCVYIDKTKFRITIFSGVPINSIYRDICKENGIELVEMPSKQGNAIKYYRTLRNGLKKARFDLIHIHGNSALAAPEVIIAKHFGIDVRIVHCHNSSNKHRLLHKVMLPIFRMVYTHGFACSTLAGEWLFGKSKTYVIPNGFEVEKFYFDPLERDKKRKELGIDDKMVIGHIGGLNEQKNQQFLIDVFNVLAEKRKDIALLMVGDGAYKEIILKKIEESRFRNRIILHEAINETQSFYNAMDVFVFPSKYEGLGIVQLEAQINGLPCISSDVVPNEVNISAGFRTLPLSAGVDKWAEAILECDLSERGRQVSHEEVKKWDIRNNVKYIEQLYEKFYEENEQ